MADNTRLTANEIAERGLICRAFYARGGKSMRQGYDDARTQGVSADWFTDPFCKVVWMAATELFNEVAANGKVSLLDIVTRSKKVASEQRDVYLREAKVSHEEFGVVEQYIRPDDTVDTFVKAVRNAVIVRQAKERFSSAIEGFANGEDPSLVLSRLIVESQNIIKDKDTCHKLSASELCDRALAEWDEAYHQRTELGNYEWCPGLPLPWRKLSYALNGFTPDMTVLAARPGVGKTSLALNFTRYWLDIGKKVTFVSVDMSPIGFVKRQIAERSSISSRKLQFGRSVNYKEDREKVIAEIQTIKELEKSGNFNLMAEYDVDVIRSTCSILKDRGEIDVLIVDYLQLLKFKGSERMTATAKTTYISNTLHELANELQIPVLCLSQLNRDNTKDGGREPQLSDLRDSGAIEQDAANVLLLYRNESLNKKWHENEPPVQFSKNRQPCSALKSYCPIYCLIAKSREGDGGTKIPFVVVQNKYAWYLGDYEAQGDAKFDRVYDDWRHDPIEKIWNENGSLIKMADIRAKEIVNINAERREAGLPEIGKLAVVDGAQVSEEVEF